MRQGFLEKEIKEDLIAIRSGSFITPILKKILLLIGCDKCFGKGYGTQTAFVGGSDDFIDKKYKWKLPTMVFCDCSRGKQLKAIINKKKK